MQDLSSTTKGSLTFGDMQPTSTVTEKTAFQPPGSVTGSVAAADIRPQVDPVGPVSAAQSAGEGDRGGLLHGQGSAPGSGRTWSDPHGNDDPGDKWTTVAAPVLNADAGH